MKYDPSNVYEIYSVKATDIIDIGSNLVFIIYSSNAVVAKLQCNADKVCLKSVL